PMPRKTDHLRLHGGTWQVRVAVPADLRAALDGKTCLMQSLGTGDLNEANLLKGVAVTRFRSMIAHARNPAASIMERARMLRRSIENGPATDPEAALNVSRAALEIAIEAGLDPDADDVNAIDAEKTEAALAAGQNFYAVASGELTPLDFHLDDWFADRRFTGKSCLQHRKAFRVLADWCNARGIEPTVQAITR